MDTSCSLISAVREGRLERVRELINSFGLSYSEAEGYVLLRDAVKYEHTAVIKLLLTSGSKVNSKSKKPSNTPLHFAVVNGNIEIVEMLLDKGANIDAINQNGRTPLHNAIENEKIEVTELLLKHGAHVNAINNEGKSPLHVAVMTGCLKIVEHLLKHGAYVNCACIYPWRQAGYTPLHIAAEEGSEEIIKFLLSSNAHINASTKDNLTPLYIATKNGHKKVVKLLLDHGANVDAQDKDGKTILHLAVEKGYPVIIEHILNYCPDVNNKNNRSSLNAAVHGYGKNLLSISSNDRTSHILNSTFQNKCEEEMESMKSEKISNSNVSFHDILTKNISQLAICATNENIVQVLKSNNYETKFPIYASMINSRFRKGVERKKLLVQEGNRFFGSLFNRLPELPYNCTEEIFSYLSDKDLRVLIHVCKHINIPNTDISDVASTLIVKGRHMQ